MTAWTFEGARTARRIAAIASAALVIMSAACAPLIQTGGSVNQLDTSSVPSSPTAYQSRATTNAPVELTPASLPVRRAIVAATGTANATHAADGASVTPRTSSTVTPTNNFWRWTILGVGLVIVGWVVWKFVFTGARIALLK